jgi:hypothetical protein
MICLPIKMKEEDVDAFEYIFKELETNLYKNYSNTD